MNEKIMGSLFVGLHLNKISVNKFIKIVFIIAFLLCLTGFENLKRNSVSECYDPFFTNFKIVKRLINSDVDEFEYVPSFKKLSVYENKIGILTFKEPYLLFKLIQIESGKSKTYKVELGRELKNFKNYYLSFGFNSKFFFLCFNKKLFLGELNFPVIKLKLIKELDDYVSYLKVFNDQVYLVDYGCRSRFKDSLTTDTYLYILNLKDYSTNFLNLGTPKGYYFCLFNPPEVLDINEKFIAQSEVSSYDIKIFDRQGKFLTQIRKKDTLFKEIDQNLHLKFVSLLQKNFVNLKTVIDSLRPIFFGGVGVIEKLNFINDSILLVRWYGPKTDINKWYPDIYYDVWLIKSDTAILIDKNIKALFPEDSILLSCEPLYSSRYECGSNYIVKFYGTYCKEFNSMNETLGDYRERQKKCYENKPKLLLTIYSFEK
jgi:hypothetical protein